MKSKYIFSSNALEQRFPYKLKKQIYISLNYFATSFKLDKPKKSYKWPIEYVVSTSLLSSQIISNFSLVPLDNFLTLGFPRNDNILNPRYSREQIIKMLNVSFKIENIILHTPTHRIGHNISTKKNVIYYKDYREELNSILNEHNALLIIVSHPSEQLSLVEGKNDRIALYKPNFQYTLYDLIPHADALITDYTTVYYDFLLTNKPVIFNFYDKEIYEKERGFAFDPIENICAGIIVKNKKDLFSAIQQTLIGFDEYKQHRKFVTSLIHKYVDGNSSERISNFCKTVFNQ
jgi:CDP-glycerol glycerophosphotransferase (TagB/SpsB family)